MPGTILMTLLIVILGILDPLLMVLSQAGLMLARLIGRRFQNVVLETNKPSRAHSECLGEESSETNKGLVSSDAVWLSWPR